METRSPHRSALLLRPKALDGARTVGAVFLACFVASCLRGALPTMQKSYSHYQYLQVVDAKKVSKLRLTTSGLAGSLLSSASSATALRGIMAIINLQLTLVRAMGGQRSAIQGV